MSDDETILLQKHRKEKKDFQAKIQNLKKSAAKDKKKRKEILDEIVKLENELEKRHTDELNEFNKIKIIDEPTSTLQENEESNPNNTACQENNSTLNQPSARISKAQKRRDKKAAVQKAKDAEIAAQEELCENGPRMLELRAILSELKKRNICLHTIRSDGDCLYNAIRHQMQITGRNCGDPDFDQVTNLRTATANYILKNKDTLIFYMTSSVTGELMTDDEFFKYCENLRSTSAWGGQIEIKALSNILKVPIEVIQANGPPTVQGEKEFSGPNLTLTYHRHMYSLGEHYNSTKPLRSGNNFDDEDDGGNQEEYDENNSNNELQNNYL